MSEKIDIDELERLSSKEKGVRGAMERIVAAYGHVENRDRTHKPSYDYRDHEIEACNITITIVRCCCGSMETEVLHVPTRIVNASMDEQVAWFEKRREQIKIRNDVDYAKEKVAAHDAREKALLAAFKNLHDPEWIHAKIVEVNGLINKNNAESLVAKTDITAFESRLDHEFDTVDKDGNVMDLLFNKKRDDGTSLFTKGSWRDICGEPKEERG